MLALFPLKFGSRAPGKEFAPMVEKRQGHGRTPCVIREKPYLIEGIVLSMLLEQPKSSAR